MNLAQTIVFYASIAFAALALVFIGLRLVRDWRLPESLVEPGRLRGRDWVWFLVCCLASRALIILITYFGTLIQQGTNGPVLPGIGDLWNRWDANHYLALAEQGYQNTGEDQLKIVFFPLFPLLIRTLSFTGLSSFASALIISNLALIIATALLFRLVSFELDRAAARRATLLFCFAPFGFFMGLAFSESLFVALSIGAYYAARRRLWWWAGALGLLTSLSRLPGVLIALPIFLEWFMAWRQREDKPRRTQWFHVFSLLGPVLGLVAYLGLNWMVFGDPWRFLAIQKDHWSQTFGFFASNLSSQVFWIGDRGGELAASIWIPQIVSFFIVMGLLIFSARRFRSSLTLFCWTYVAITFGASWLLSGGRYLAALFPIYCLWAGLVKRQLGFLLVFGISVGLLVLYCLWFVMGGNIM